MPLLGSAKYGQPRKDTRPNLRVPGAGPVPCDIMLIGERPGEREAKEGKPFVGAVGQILNMLLDDVGLSRQSIYITNLVKEYADYEKPSEFEIRRDWPELVDEIHAVRPRVVGLMGTFAVEQVLSIDRAHMERNHGLPIRSAFDAVIGDVIWIPMFHPAAGLYNQNHMAMCMQDLEVLARVARTGVAEGITDEFYGRERYRNIGSGSGSGDGGYTVRADVAIDTEGSRKHPWCLTYSCEPGMSWLQRPSSRPLSFEGKVWLHSSLHDLSVLRSMGVYLRDGQYVDTMVLAYLLCLEPQGLKDLAFRHAGMSMDSYSDIIGPASRDKAIEYLMGVNACEWSPSQEYCIVKAGKVKITKPQSINQRVRRILGDLDADKRNKHGDQVDPRDRWNNIEDYLKQEVVEVLGPMPEATLDDVPTAKAERYACRDSDATFRIAPVLEEKITRLGLDRVAAIDHAIIPMIDRMQYTGFGLAPESFWDEMERKCDNIKWRKVYEIRECTGATINPDSSKQVAELLYEQLGLPATKFTDGGDKSTKDKALEALYRAHPVVDMVLDYREASKVLSSYVNPLRAIVRRGENRVHPNLRITRVSSGRLAANNPNLLAIPVRSKLGKEIRGGFIAAPGRVLMDLDLDQVEMRWMADESRDAGLVGIFVRGTEDVHTRTAAGMFGVNYADVLYQQRYAAKRVGFGIITGITEYGLVDQMALARAARPDGSAWTTDDCKRMIEEYFKLYPGVKVYMEKAGDEAEAQGWVADKWGRRRYLPGARSPIPAVRAESRRQASSHKIQAGAQGLMKQAMQTIWQIMLQLAQGCKWEEMWPVEALLQIHDSLVFDIIEDCMWVKPILIEAMTTTVRSQTGLPFKAKGGVGAQWDKIE